MNKRLIVFLIFTLSLISLMSAQPPFQTSVSADKSILIESPVKIDYKLNTNNTFYAHPHNSSDGTLLNHTFIEYCQFHLYNGNDTEINMSPSTENNYEWYVILTKGNFTDYGEYSGYIYCQVPENIEKRGGYFNFGFDLTFNGNLINDSQVYSRIFLILLFILGIIFIQWIQKRIDFDSWYNKMADKYQTKNTFKWVMSAVGYNIFNNLYIFSYLIGLLGLLVLTETTYLLNITSVISIMSIILELYTWGALIVAVIFFSQVQEWLMKWKDDIEKVNWGELTSIK